MKYGILMLLSIATMAVCVSGEEPTTTAERTKIASQRAREGVLKGVPLVELVGVNYREAPRSAGSGVVSIENNFDDTAWTLDLTDASGSYATLTFVRTSGEFEWKFSHGEQNGVEITLPQGEDVAMISLGNVPIYRNAALARVAIIADIVSLESSVAAAAADQDAEMPVAELERIARTAALEASLGESNMDVVVPGALPGQIGGVNIMITADGAVTLLTYDSNLAVVAVDVSSLNMAIGMATAVMQQVQNRFQVACDRLFKICSTSQNEETAVQACSAFLSHCSSR